MPSTKLDSQAVTYPADTTANRPVSPTAGVIRFNTTLKAEEYYDGTSWKIKAPLGSFSNPAASGTTLLTAGYISGYYWIKPNSWTGSPQYCYVDNTNYGGGWVLVQSVGSSTNYHWAQTGDYNLYATTDSQGLTANTVAFSGAGYSSTTGRRFSDAFVRSIGAGGEGVFRLENARNGASPSNNTTLTGSTDYKSCQFVRYDNGISWYNSANNGGDSDKFSKTIDIAHYYPYSSNWETGGSGHYALSAAPYKVFDGHSDPSTIATSLYPSVRFLWGYTGASGNGIYGGSNASYTFITSNDGNPGYMWIK